MQSDGERITTCYLDSHEGGWGDLQVNELAPAQMSSAASPPLHRRARRSAAAADRRSYLDFGHHEKLKTLAEPS